MADSKESTEVSTEFRTGQLIPQPHGGALRYGGPSKGGTGQPPSELRRRLRGSFAQRVAVIEEIADRKVTLPVREVCPECGYEGEGKPLTSEQIRALTPRVADQLKAIELMAKYGLGVTKELTVEHVRDRLSATVMLIRSMLPAEQAEEILDRMQSIWE